MNAADAGAACDPVVAQPGMSGRSGAPASRRKALRRDIFSGRVMAANLRRFHNRKVTVSCPSSWGAKLRHRPREARMTNRRRFMEAALTSLVLPRSVYAQAPAIVTSERSRPQVPSGLQIGDVTGDRALIWSRTDRPARMYVERSYREDFAGAVTARGPLALDTTDYTARLDLTGLAPDREVFVRVRFEDVSTGRARSEPLLGRFRTPPAGRRDVTFAWSGDTAGQGWGINKDWGGMKCYEAVRRDRPDFFIPWGGHIYADGPIAAEVKLPGDAEWKNLVTEEVSKVAETLKEFRGRYAYNRMDDNVRRLAAEAP